MFARFTKPALVLVLALATATGCAAPDSANEGTETSEQTGTQAQAATAEASLIDTAVAFGGKVGPVLSLGSMIYGFYQDVPGKLEAMNARLDNVVSNTAAIKQQVGQIDAKLDAQFQADVVGPLAAAESYIAIDMKNQMAMLASPGKENVANDWAVYSNALNAHYAAADTASQKLLASFFPEGTKQTYTAAQSQRIFALYLRASLVKVALRDAKATLAVTYSDRTQNPDYAAAQTTSIANLVDTVGEVVPQLRILKASFITARNVPGALAQKCNPNGTYTVGRTIGAGKGRRYIEQTWSYYAFGDTGAAYTSPNYGDLASCTSTLDAYKAPLAANVDAWVNDNMEAPIAALESIPANWEAARKARLPFRPFPQ